MKIANWIYLDCLLYSVNKCQSCVLIINMQGNYAILVFKKTWTVGRSLCSHFLSNAPKLQQCRRVGILLGRKRRKHVASLDILKNARHWNWSLTSCTVNLLWPIKSIISCITSGLPEQFLAETTGQLQVSFSFVLFCFVISIIITIIIIVVVIVIIIMAVTKGQGTGISPVSTDMNPGYFHRQQ